MQEKPRGYFKVSENWQSSDSGEDYFPGWMNKVGWPLIKTALLCVIFRAGKVVRFCGDLYYEKMSDEEALSKMFYKLPAGKELSNQRDIDCFIRDNLSERLPMDGPLIRHYMQEYDPDDQQHLPPEKCEAKATSAECLARAPEKRNKGVCITKYHHGMCDGVSFMCMVLGLGKEYSRDYFIKSSDAKWY